MVPRKGKQKNIPLNIVYSSFTSKMKFIDLTPFKNKRTGQLSIVIPKKKLKDKKGDYLWVRVKIGGKK